MYGCVHSFAQHYVYIVVHNFFFVLRKGTVLQQHILMLWQSLFFCKKASRHISFFIPTHFMLYQLNISYGLQFFKLKMDHSSNLNKSALCDLYSKYSIMDSSAHGSDISLKFYYTADCSRFVWTFCSGIFDLKNKHQQK